MLCTDSTTYLDYAVSLLDFPCEGKQAFLSEAVYLATLLCLKSITVKRVLHSNFSFIAV